MRKLTVIVTTILSCSIVYGQMSSPGGVVRFTDTSGNVIPAGDNANNALRVNVVAGSGGNSAASATGSAVPASASYNGLNVSGTLRGQTGVNPTGSVYSAQTDITSVNAVTVATAAAGIMKVGLTDGTGNAITSTGGFLNIQISGGSIANTSFGISAGTAFIGTVAPKTPCGTTYYDSGPINLPNALGVLTSTATCVEAIICNSIDSSAAHPVTVTDSSTACNSITCNLIPPGFVLSPLQAVRFPADYVKAVGGIKWNTDAVNKVTCSVEGYQ